MTHKSDTFRLKQSQRGFTLVEGLVAAALVAVGFAAVINLFPTSYSNIAYSGNQTLAANYVQQKVEQLKNFSFNSIDTTNCSSVGEDLGNGFSRSCVLTTDVGAGALQRDFKKVRVTVTWPGGARPGSTAIETLFTR